MIEMTGLEKILEWTDNRFGLVALAVCMFNLYFIRGVSVRLNKCQNTDMCQVLHHNLTEKIDRQGKTLDEILKELRENK
jgi:hypothetical protein